MPTRVYWESTGSSGHVLPLAFSTNPTLASPTIATSPNGQHSSRTESRHLSPDQIADHDPPGVSPPAGEWRYWPPAAKALRIIDPSGHTEPIHLMNHRRHFYMS